MLARKPWKVFIFFFLISTLLHLPYAYEICSWCQTVLSHSCVILIFKHCNPQRKQWSKYALWVTLGCVRCLDSRNTSGQVVSLFTASDFYRQFCFNSEKMHKIRQSVKQTKTASGRTCHFCTWPMHVLSLGTSSRWYLALKVKYYQVFFFVSYVIESE